MGELVHFDKGLRQGRRCFDIPVEGATILFFLGVRYERWERADDACNPVNAIGAAPRQRSKGGTGAGQSAARRKRRP